MVTLSDKGRITVLLDKSMYNDKAYQFWIILLHKIFKKDFTPSIPKKLNCLIGTLEKNNLLYSSLARYLKFYTESAPIYFMHQRFKNMASPSVLLLIVQDSLPIYDLSRFLSILLKPLTVSSSFLLVWIKLFSF